MGWNHWYAHYNRVTDKMMREAADVMVASGMADVGYQYVNIDDCWMKPGAKDDPSCGSGRCATPQGNILRNAALPRHEGPDRLHPRQGPQGRHLHLAGPAAPAPASPAPTSTRSRTPRQFAEWGFDFLKYDWCSYGEIAGKGSRASRRFKKPYRLMGEILKQPAPRHRLQPLPVRHGRRLGVGRRGRRPVAGAPPATWASSSTGFFEVALTNAEHRDCFDGPGPGTTPTTSRSATSAPPRAGREPQPCPLTPNEQYSFMSLWCLMAAPLFYSGDMSRLDAFTLNVLCNPEVIEVDQDPLGKPGRRVSRQGPLEVWVQTWRTARRPSASSTAAR